MISLSEALEIFSINDINEVWDIDLKKRYRGLVRKYHPDNGMDGSMIIKVNSSYKILQELKETAVPVIEKKSVVLTLATLIRAFKGEKVKVGNEYYNASDLRRGETFIIIQAFVNEDTVVGIQKLNMENKYIVDGTVYVDNINNKEKVTFGILDRKLTVDMEALSLEVNFTLEENIKVLIRLTKKIRRTDE